MRETPESLARRLEQEGEKTISYLQQFPSAHLDVQVYEDGAAWTVRQVFMHLVEAEGSIPRLIADVLEGGEGVPEDFDLDRYNESRVRKMGSLSKEEIIKRFSDLRNDNVKMVSGIDEKDLQVTGRHPFWEETTVEEMLRAMYMNVKVHVRDIKRVLQES